MNKLKEQNWKKFRSHMKRKGYKFDGNKTYAAINGGNQYRFIIHKHSVQYEKLIGIGRWKKLNIGVWYIKDLHIEDNKLLFKRNDFRE